MTIKNENTLDDMEGSCTPLICGSGNGQRRASDKETGIIVAENTPKGLAEGIVFLLMDPEKYDKIKHNAWHWSRTFDFEKSYSSVLNKIKESL